MLPKNPSCRPSRSPLSQLALAPVDLLSLPETQRIAGELADRILRVVAQARPASVPATAQIEILSDRNRSGRSRQSGSRSGSDCAGAHAIDRAARPIEPADLVAQGDTPGSIDTADLQSRADASETQLRAALAALKLQPLRMPH